MRACLRSLAAACALLVALPGMARGAIVTIDNTFIADFQFTATALGEAIFNAPEGLPLDVRAIGNLSLSFDDTGGNSVLFTDATGQLSGVTPPTPLPFLPFYITPVRFDGGSLTNITRDGLGRIISGTITDLAMPWEMIGTGGNAGIVLYGDQATTPLLFNGDVTINYDSGTPRFGVGSILSGFENFNVYLHQSGDRANQDPGTDPLVFIGSNRTLTAVPEPSTMGAGLFAIAVIAGRRFRSARQRRSN